MSPIVPYVDVEARARRLMRYLGGGLSTIRGSQAKHAGYPYYTEVLAHELGHMVLYGADGPRCLEDTHMARVFDMHKDPNKQDLAERHAVNNRNEIETSAATTLVLEWLGLTYELWPLLSSTTHNLRGRIFMLKEVYPLVREARQQEHVQAAALKIVARLLKVQEDQLER
jgi:hypothetical protein